MSRLYAAMLRLTGRRCVVVGGGQVATRKVGRLLQSGAAVTLVAPSVTADLERLIQAGLIQVECREYRRGDLAGAALAFAATDSRPVNAAVAAEAAELGIPANVADDPAASTLQVPTTIERGGVTVAISTGGRSPAFARRLREELEPVLSLDRLELFELYAELRTDLAAGRSPVDGSAWARTDDRVLTLLRQGRRAEARQALREQLLAPAAEV